MRIVDCHVHMMEEIRDASPLLQAMDRNGVARLLVISKNERKSLEITRENLQQASALCAQAPDRLTGLAWLEPTIPGMDELVKRALGKMKFTGIKIIPDHWYAYEERLQSWWELLNELEASILFHTGILYAHEDDSRFCRPVYLETMLYYPKIRFAMSHIAWPWCEECLAVMGRMRATGNIPWQSYIDITAGTPPHIRKQALANALAYCGPERLMFGTDSCIPDDLEHHQKRIADDSALFTELGLTAAQQERIFSGTADELFPAVS